MISIECQCSVPGSKNELCNENGECDCNDNINGLKCEKCMENHYNFPGCKGNFLHA